jgi:hypothetical protein
VGRYYYRVISSNSSSAGLDISAVMLQYT